MGSDCCRALAHQLIGLGNTRPNSAPLQRLQIIKGWTVNGEHNEQVYDVACSDGGQGSNYASLPRQRCQSDIGNCDISQAWAQLN